MRDHGRMNRLDDVHRDPARADPVEQAQPIAEENWRQRDGELIDQAGVEVLRTTCAPPAIRMSLPRAASRACCKALAIPSLTKWNLVPPSRSQGPRTSLVKTKTGVWRGASSGQFRSPS